MKIGIDIGLTVCTNEQKRNFARLGFSINEIDTNGDIVAQAEEGINAVMTVFGLATDEMETIVETGLGDLGELTPESIKSDLREVKAAVEHIKGNLMQRIGQRFVLLDERIAVLEK